MKRGTFLALAAWTCLLAMPAAPALAQAYPGKPIRFIVPFPAGGGTDMVARAVGQRLFALLGQQVIVDNRPGAGGIIGVEAVARSAADGYSVLIAGVAELTMFPSLYRKLSYDTLRNFQPLSLLALTPQVLVVNPSVVPVANLRELIAHARANPGRINYGTFGPGSLAHIMVELFAVPAGIKLTSVSYKGSPPALQDLLGGQIGLMLLSPALAKSQIDAGKLRGIAVSTKERIPALPEIASIHEAGIENYDASSWIGSLLPAGTPQEIVIPLNEAMVKAVNSPEVQKFFFASGIAPLANTPEQFTQFIRREIEKWGSAIRPMGLTLD